MDKDNSLSLSLSLSLEKIQKINRKKSNAQNTHLGLANLQVLFCLLYGNCFVCFLTRNTFVVDQFLSYSVWFFSSALIIFRSYIIYIGIVFFCHRNFRTNFVFGVYFLYAIIYGGGVGFDLLCVTVFCSDILLEPLTGSLFACLVLFLGLTLWLRSLWICQFVRRRIWNLFFLFLFFIECTLERFVIHMQIWIFYDQKFIMWFLFHVSICLIINGSECDYNRSLSFCCFY